MNDRNDSSQSVWQRLLHSSKKGRGGPYTRYVNRHAAIPMTWLLWKAGFSPNVVSIVSFCITHSAFAVIVVTGASIPAAVCAYLLLVFGYMLDSCDGQLARVTGNTSSLGNWLDHSLDIVKIININLVICYVMISAAVAEGGSLTLPFMAAALNILGQTAHFYVVGMKCLLFTADSNQAEQRSGRRNVIDGVVMFFADYGIFIMMILLLPWQELFVPVYLGYGVFALLLLIGHFAITSMRVARQS